MRLGFEGNVVRRVLPIFGLLVLLLTLFPSESMVSAAQITSRSLTLQANGTTGGSDPGGVVNHLFAFTLPTSASVGSIEFQYCTTASGGSCTTPTGLSTTSATMGTQSGATGFTLNHTTNGAPYVTRTAASITGPQAVSYQLVGVTNPSAANYSFYVRISDFTSTDTTGSPIDTGTVTASTANQITLTGVMPESLIFCTGALINETAGIPDCTTATAGTISFNQLFSPTAAATATSQMAASTNAGSGYVITYSGTTLTSGSNTIPAMPYGVAVVGTGQFGLNLVANTTASSTPAVGAAITPASDGVNWRGQAITNYNTADHFQFLTSGDTVANSANGGAGPTNSQIYTVSYLVNVSGDQYAGTYTTTLTYICTPTF